MDELPRRSVSPVPLIVPPDNVVGPESVIVPAPDTVPPDRAKSLLKFPVVVIDSEPAENEKLDAHVTLWATSAALVLWVMRTFA
jgi:hypothetical protein